MEDTLSSSTVSVQAPSVTVREPSKRFMSWRDMVLSPLVLLTTWGIAGVGAWAFNRATHLGSLVNLAVFLSLLFGVSILIIRTILTLHPLKDGIYGGPRHATTRYVWNLVGFLCITNLYPLYVVSMVPPPLRKFFYALLGARLGKGMLVISGTITDPYAVKVDENAVIGADSLLLSHTLTANDTLIISTIEVGRGAVVGARSVLMPGVKVGEGAMINALSLVPMNTVIGPGEVWGGMPAKRLS